MIEKMRRYEEIVSSISGDIFSEEMNDLQYQEVHEKITMKETEKAADLLRRFLKSSENIVLLEKTLQLQKDSARQPTSSKHVFFRNKWMNLLMTNCVLFNRNKSVCDTIFKLLKL